MRTDATRVRALATGVTAVLAMAGCSVEANPAQPTEDAFEPADSSGVIATVSLSDDPEPMTVLGSKERLLVWARDSTGTVVCAKWAPGCASWTLTDPFEWEVTPSDIVSLQD